MSATIGHPATTAASPNGPRIDTTTITLATALVALAGTTGGPWALTVLAVVTAVAIHHTRP